MRATRIPLIVHMKISRSSSCKHDSHGLLVCLVVLHYESMLLSIVSFMVYLQFEHFSSL